MVEVLEVLNLLSFIPSFVAEGLEFVDKLPATATRLEVSVPVVYSLDTLSAQVSILTDPHPQVMFLKNLKLTQINLTSLLEIWVSSLSEMIVETKVKVSKSYR